MEERELIRVIVADDHHLVREGIRALLERADDLQVVGEADDGQKAINLVERLFPDVLVIDIGMPQVNGIEATKQLRAKAIQVSVVILSMHSDPMLVRRALRSGANCYVLKQSVSNELLLAIRAAFEGRMFLSPAISTDLLKDYLNIYSKTEKETPLDLLSEREQEVLKLIAEGKTNNQIANILKLSVKTVEKHRTNLMNKLGMHDIASLTRLAIKYKLIMPDEDS
jgi:DNA-binding NarL/FixJ family response regulator